MSLAVEAPGEYRAPASETRAGPRSETKIFTLKGLRHSDVTFRTPASLLSGWTPGCLMACDDPDGGQGSGSSAR